MSPFQRSLNTLQYHTGTQNGVLIIEVSAIQRFVIERFHCTTSFEYDINHRHNSRSIMVLLNLCIMWHLSHDYIGAIFTMSC